jgi:hypothetical protein
MPSSPEQAGAISTVMRELPMVIAEASLTVEQLALRPEYFPSLPRSRLVLVSIVNRFIGLALAVQLLKVPDTLLSSVLGWRVTKESK